MTYTIVFDKFFSINLVTAIVYGLFLVGWAKLRFPEKCHGFSWYLFPIFRIIGALFGIFTSGLTTASKAIFIISGILAWLGLGFLLMAPLGVLASVPRKAGRNIYYSLSAAWLKLGFFGTGPAIAGVILPQLASESITNLSNVASILLRVGAIIYLVFYLLSLPLTALLLWEDLKKKKMIESESWALRGIGFSIPFFLVRFGYQASATFAPNNWSFMQSVLRFQVMEYIIILINLTAAFFCYRHRNDIRCSPAPKDTLSSVSTPLSQEEGPNSLRARREITVMARAAVRELPSNIGPSSSGAYWYTDGGIPDGLITMLRNPNVIAQRDRICYHLDSIVEVIPMPEKDGVVHIDYSESLELLRAKVSTFYPVWFVEPEEGVVAAFALQTAILKWMVINGAFN